MNTTYITCNSNLERYHGILKRPRLRVFLAVLTAFLTVAGINIPQNNFDGLNRLKIPLNAIVVFYLKNPIKKIIVYINKNTIKR